jgi:hypothetical protein
LTSANQDTRLKKYVSPTALFWIFYTIAAAIVCAKNYSTIVEDFMAGALLPTSMKVGVPVTVIDFVANYVGAILGRMGLDHPMHIYDPAVQLGIMRDLTKPYIPSNTLYCPYPPYFFLLLAPLTFIGLMNSYVFFCWLGVIANLAAIYAVFRKLGWTYIIVGAVMVMCCSPMCQSFLLGSTSMFVFPALTLYAMTWETKRPITTALAMFPYWFKFQYAPIQALPALQRNPFKFGATAAISIAILVVISGAALGFYNYKEWGPWATEQTYLPLATEFENIRGQLAFLPNAAALTAPPASTARFAVAFLLSAVFFFFEVPRLSRKQPNIEIAKAAFSVGVLFSAVASPYTYGHDFTMAILPCIWIWFWARQYKDQLGKPIYSIIEYMTVGFPLLSWAFMALDPILMLIHIKAYAVWCELLIVVTLTAVYKVCYCKVEGSQ